MWKTVHGMLTEVLQLLSHASASSSSLWCLCMWRHAAPPHSPWRRHCTANMPRARCFLCDPFCYSMCFIHALLRRVGLHCRGSLSRRPASAGKFSACGFLFHVEITSIDCAHLWKEKRKKKRRRVAMGSHQLPLCQLRCCSSADAGRRRAA